MYTGILEATRLTREGRLSEAMALIQRSLGVGPFHADDPHSEPGHPDLLDAQFQVLEPPRTAQSDHDVGVSPEHTYETPGPPSPGVVPPEANTKASPQSKRWHRRPRPGVHPFEMPDIAGVPLADILKDKLEAGLRTRRVPAEAIAPSDGRWIEATCTVEHGSRVYKLYVPSGVDHQPMPLVVMLHGCTQDPDDFAAGTAMNFLAERDKFLVAYPAQAGTANPNRCWNWFQPADQQRDHGEPAIIAAITRQVLAEYKADPGRVYVAGMSAGGAMAAIMAAAYPHLYVAVGVHSGPVPGSAHDLPSAFQAMQQGARNDGGRIAARVPLIVFHGDQDQTVNPCNAEHLVEQWATPDIRGESVAKVPRVKVLHNRSAGGREYTRTLYQDADGRAVVERWTLHGVGHAWSGGSRNGSYTDPAGPDASRELVRFFRDHARVARVVTG